ncbi:MEIOTIC F-BOX protein MOF [Lolium perenne]|uniref:MEIOTIC F-BOX protein MOF n=1 Tax=Lolium perenne TaxID=4522 RepID=UPI0021F5F4F4|nr:MEIOTIC F-BOX protein MOF-like [Lolium perenne]
MEISRKRKHVCAGGDRLMDLPDSLLHTILSNLTAREVVQTCALSRRWRHVWLSAPSLDIDFREFRSAADPGDAAKSHKTMLQQEEFVQFEDFADNLLCRRSTSGASLDTLRLRFECPQTTTHGRWVRRGLKCCPAVLDIRHGAGNLPIPFQLPPVGSGGARRLRKLCLDGLALPSDFEEQLRSEFRVLEDLEIRNCRMTWVSRIASDTLKNLTVECPQNDGKLLIVAPCLASLHIALRSSYYDITLGEAHSLVQASISLVGTIQQQRYWPTTELRALCKLLRALSNVNSLELVGFQEMMSHMNQSPGEYAPGPMLQAMLDEDNHRLPTFRTLMNGTNLNSVAFSAKHSRA